MVDVQVGAGGWAYFGGPSGSALRDYARAFSFVEVNSTFYELPTASSVRRWRASVPGGFRFAIKAPQTLTHRIRLRPGPRLERVAGATARILDALRASDIVLETPPSLVFSEREIDGLIRVREAFDEAPGVVSVGLEARAYRGRPLPPSLRRSMERHGIVDVVDLSTATPRTDAPTAYSRLFGEGQGNRWEFTNTELREIAGRARETGAERMVFAFHGVRMYKDAARFLTFERTGSFPRATRSVGLDSLREVLRDANASFPATGAALMADHGWRVIDLDASRNAHAASLLGQLPPRRTFRSASEVLSTLAAGSVVPLSGTEMTLRGRGP